jgi:hypothetical protein
VHNTIEKQDLLDAIVILQDAETLLPEVLAQVGANSQRPREDQVVEWVKARGVVRETALRAYMRNFFETRLIGPTLDELVRAGMLVEENEGQFVSPHRKYRAA